MHAAHHAQTNRTARGSKVLGQGSRSGRVRASVRGSASALLRAAAWTAALGISITAGLGVAGPFSPAALAQTASTSGGGAGARTEPWSSSAVNVVVPQRRVISIRPDVGAVKMSAVVTNVAVVDQVSTTTLEITLSNPNPRIMEAELVLPVPEGAVVKGFELEGLPNEGKARILPRDEARRIYESIVRQTRDPGLVEFIGSSLIRSSVFPVPASGTQKLRISYEQVLPADGPRVDYILPRSDALAESGVEWSASMTISSSKPIATVYSPSHSLAVDRRGPGEVHLKVTGAMGSTPGSLRVSYLLDPAKDASNRALSATLFTYPDLELTGGGGYFMLLAGLPSGVTAANVKTAKEVTLVIDRSGSMKGPKIEQAKKAALQVLEGLDTGDAFNLIDYSDSIGMFSPRPVVKNADTMNSIRSYVGTMQANGGTNLHDALIESLSMPPLDAERLPMVLFLTDGLPTVGQTQEAAIRSNAQKSNKFNRRVFTFGVGYDVNVPLLSGVALESRAASTFVLPDEDVEQKVSQVYRRLQGPVITSPALTAALATPTNSIATVPVRDLMPATMPDVFEGDQILVLGTYSGTAPIALTLTGTMGKEPIAYNVSLDPAAASLRHSFVPRLWANRRIGFLNDQITKLTADTGAINQNDPRMKELIEEIVRLSTKWGILTEYTAFLADDTTDRRAFSEPSSPEIRRRAADSMAPAVQSRAGDWPVLQEKNRAAPASSGGRQTTNLAAQNAWVDKDGQQRSVSSVWQTADQTMFFRNNRWVDVRALKHAEKAADPAAFDRVITVGTDDYFTLAGELAAQGRQSLLAQTGEIELSHEGKRVLVKP